MLYRFKLGWMGVFVLLVFWGAQPTARAGLKVYYIRHGQSGSNVAKDWEKVPKEQWPAYVGNADAFSPKGEEQVANVAAKLKPCHFDFIAASPLWRTRNTILPYLKENNLKAEIWPELEEFSDLKQDMPFSAPSPDLFTGGKAVEVPENERAWFVLREDASLRVKMSREAPQTAADARAMLARAVEMIRKRFGGKEQSILLVGHGRSGGYLLELLLEDESLFPSGTEDKNIWNTGVWMAEQQPDGKFKLILLNDKPYGETKTEVSPVSAAPAK